MPQTRAVSAWRSTRRASTGPSPSALSERTCPRGPCHRSRSEYSRLEEKGEDVHLMMLISRDVDKFWVMVKPPVEEQLPT